jgi:co-chaperonin GroES (HSP10)
MRPLHHFIVQLPKKFKDELEVAGEKIKIITKFDEFGYRINYGKIVAAPISYKGDFQEGDWLYFHHHVVMESIYDIGDDLYMVNYESDGGYANHAIGIQDEAGNINMLGDWCFVAPADEPEEETTNSGIILSIKEEPKLEGELLAIPKDSEWIGTKSGDLVGYTKNSQYKMELVSGKKVYRMRTTELVYVKES